MLKNELNVIVILFNATLFTFHTFIQQEHSLVGAFCTCCGRNLVENILQNGELFKDVLMVPNQSIAES